MKVCNKSHIKLSWGSGRKGGVNEALPEHQLAARRRLSGRLQSAPCWPPTLSNELVFQSSRPSGGDETSRLFFFKTFSFFLLFCGRGFFFLLADEHFEDSWLLNLCREILPQQGNYSSNKQWKWGSDCCCAQPRTPVKKQRNPAKFLQNLQHFPIKIKKLKSPWKHWTELDS